MLPAQTEVTEVSPALPSAPPRSTPLSDPSMATRILTPTPSSDLVALLSTAPAFAVGCDYCRFGLSISDGVTPCVCRAGQARRQIAEQRRQAELDEQMRMTALRQQRREERFGLHLPARYAGLTLETLAERSTADRPKRIAIAAARQYLRDGKLNGREGLFVHGPCEMGKTGLSVAITRELLAAGRSVLWTETLRFLRRAFTDDGKVLVDQAESVDLLVLDNFGSTETTDAQDNLTLETRGRLKLLFEIINYRSAQLRPMIFTSNLSPAELALQYGESIASRIYEACAAIEMTGQPLRR